MQQNLSLDNRLFKPPHYKLEEPNWGADSHPNKPKYQYEPNLSARSSHISAGETIHQLRNFVGMMLEELRYSCNALKQEVNRDKVAALRDYDDVKLALKEINDKTEMEASYHGASRPEQADLRSTLRENENLRAQVERLTREGQRHTLDLQKQLQKVKQQSYDTFEENFILNQKVQSLQAELEGNTIQLIQQLKLEHQDSTQDFHQRIRQLQEVIREKDQNISILERLAKDYELVHHANDVLTNQPMPFSKFSNDSRPQLRRKQTPNRNDSFKDSKVDYQSNRHNYSSNVGELRAIDTSSFGPSANPPLTPFSPYTNLGYYRDNTAGIPESPSSNQYIPQSLLQQIDSPYYDRSAHYPTSSQSQHQRSGIYQMPSSSQYAQMPPRPQRKPASRPDYSRQEGGMLSFAMSRTASSKQFPVAKSREQCQKASRQGKRQPSREHRLQSSRQSKVDLAKIQQQLQGLAKELKTQLQTISKKKQ